MPNRRIKADPRQLRSALALRAAYAGRSTADAITSMAELMFDN